MTVTALKKNNMKKRSGFKMKSGNKPDMTRLAGISPMKADEDFPGLVDFEVEVSGGKKTKQGEFMQDKRGSSVTGSSVRHSELRKKLSKSKNTPNAPKLTSAERTELRDLNMTTEKAYKKR